MNSNIVLSVIVAYLIIDTLYYYTKKFRQYLELRTYRKALHNKNITFKDYIKALEKYEYNQELTALALYIRNKEEKESSIDEKQ